MFFEKVTPRLAKGRGQIRLSTYYEGFGMGD